MAEVKSFLGTGWGFPPTFDKKNKAVVMVSDEEDIRQSLFILMSTMLGERVTNPSYGSNIHSYIFDPVDGIFEFMLRREIERSVLYFEPRITLNEVEFDKTQAIDGIILITLHYTVRKINVRSNIVYPFYKLEGTLIDEDKI